MGWGQRWATAWRWELLGMFLNEGEKENFLIAERVLESSKKEKRKEREREREREWISLEWSEWGRMREKRKIKEGDRDSGHVCEGEKQDKK